jgi:Zn-dependent M28 family amino/carboxypeptidase
MMKNILFILILLAALSLQILAQPADSPISTQAAIAESVKLVPCKSKERLAEVKKLFAQMGAKDDEITVEKFNKDKINNVVVRKKGKLEETVIIGAHYDKTEEGCGAIDNWTGVSVVAHLYQTIRQLETEKSYIFVAFDQEEEGLLGSEAMAKAIPKESLPEYCAMVNIDSLGFTLPYALRSISSPKMTSIAKTVAEENKMKFYEIDITGASSDSASFKNRRIPAITFSGLDNQWKTYLHSSSDKLEKIKMESVYLSYRFVLAFIGKLEKTTCSELGK